MSDSCRTPCSCDSPEAPSQHVTTGAGEWVSKYSIPKMDCPSEERMIRMALGGLDNIRGCRLIWAGAPWRYFTTTVPSRLPTS